MSSTWVYYCAASHSTFNFFRHLHGVESFNAINFATSVKFDNVH
jgi:hypothetical protein